MDSHRANPHDGADERSSRARGVIDDCLRRRLSGESLSDDQVISSHPDLMPELDEGLRKLALIQRAVRRGRETSSRGTINLTEDDRLEAVPSRPDAIPGYEIMGEIHRGGQGVVYQAIQQSTKREVAVKVMKEGPFASWADRVRFEREIEILGQLNHPNIVTIHDSGTAAGSFYYVMDYIAGRPLDDYVTLAKPSVEQALRLFAKICDGVNAAHLRGVIHRDLKPGNIRIDGDGEPHVLDFGLAKMAAAQATDGTQPPVMSMTGQFFGSLPWASPEQAEALPSKIDLRTDVYSLGVILYHMLTRRFPYDVVGNIRDVLDNILRAEPARPSTIRRDINDEIDTIVLKCLSKERERRYQSAGELARDVRHYLAGEPIEAKRDSGWYVFKKTLRRHRLPVAGACALLLTLTGGLVATSTLYARAVAAEARAKRRFDDVRKLANTFMFDFHDKIENLAGATPAREYLVKTALEYLDKLAAEAGDDPSLQRELAQAYQKVGDVQGNPSLIGHLGNTQGAFASHRKALQILESLSATDPDNPQVRCDLATAYCKLGNLYRETGEMTEALASYRKSLEIREALSAADPTNVEFRRGLASEHCNLGLVLAMTRQFEEALASYRKSLEINEALLTADPNDPQTRRDLSISHERIGSIQHQAGHTEQALASYRTALGIREALAVLDPNSAEIRRGLSVIHCRIGILLARTGQIEEALASCHKSVEIAEALSEADPANAVARRDLAVSCFNTGSVNAGSGSDTARPIEQRLEHYREARKWFQRAREIFEDMQARGILPCVDANAPDGASAAIARCDAAIAELEQTIEPAVLASQPASPPR
ncbi:MAG TPA: serine/threonine-protein kinase [Phycisphaerae bacterium]|nr:serine/threonine-protein kinase [Phycisphaerae bacterium]